ncbi:anaphase promoting complex APC subunit 2 [Nitzschia inconspicua]|uniref:Anaphase promoting complex APC subunit 2 n=1 Tax=Nitzschia inconspicua TaxID=303405 RepID=A0A9K3LMY6_9STRA|nr:anaphase promoting complex APC subunit 2 [Nitzschia inconspicua]
MSHCSQTPLQTISYNEKPKDGHDNGIARFVAARPSNVAAKTFFEKEVYQRDWTTLPGRLERLSQTLEAWDAENGSPEMACSLSSDPKESRRLSVTASIMVEADPRFLHGFYMWFCQSLRGRYQRYIGEEWDGEQLISEEDEAKLFQSVQKLGWIRTNGMLQKPLCEALHNTTLTWVKEAISMQFEEKHFEDFQGLKDQLILPWLELLVGPEDIEKDNWRTRLNFTVAECYCLVRTKEIFELVAEFPDSHSAVEELKEVLEITKMHQDIARALKAALIRRLNHPGASTSQIIDMYINVIKVFRELDPSDRLLQVVAEPVRTYLRKRQNTVRCIITSLTDAEMGGDLYEELRRQDARPLEEVQVDSDDEEEPPDMNWQPPPPLNKQRGNFLGTGNKSGGGDILSMLVSIYGSKDLFVNEFRLMLADKLLSNLKFNTDQEVHTVELLKLRFGEISMRNVEIMVKDIEDSKRIISNIHTNIKAKQRVIPVAEGREPADPIVDAAIISHIFWPTLQNQQFKPHARIQAQLDQFSTEYGQLKNPRRLVWMNQLGSVQLELDVVEEKPDGTAAIETREFSVAPLLATLISYFEDKDVWTAEELSNETGLAEHIIQKRMAYWINNRVIKQLHGQPVRYEVATREHFMQHDHENAAAMEDDGMEGNAVSVLAQEEEEMEVFESYIVGMLTNLGQLPLSRIHNMLKMYVSGGSDVKYSKTPQQLGVFLQQLCRQEKLECGPDGMYKLFKK